MKAYRIISPSSHPLWRWLLQSRGAHYATALLSAALGLGISVAGHRWFGSNERVLILFIAVVVASVLGGLGPGLLATALVVCGEKAISASNPVGVGVALVDLRLILAEGIVMSCLGGGLIAARRRARETESANQDLERRVLEIGEAERQRIGHDLHDGLGQVLTGIALLSESMAQRIHGGQLPDADQAETITRLVSEAIGNTRDLARNLAPLTLERDGLLAALEEHSQYAPQLYGITCRWEHTGAPPNIDHSRALHLYRIAQEAVNNSVKHGRAPSVKISLEVTDPMLRLAIIDDGSGLSPKTVASPGLGLRIMRYRARMIDALLTVERAGPAGGTIVTCTCRNSEGGVS
ncbi:MAG TPA: sensor histidine kinase [Tepidisphaeraceae bacterium]|nr:sensor histidine kinase [Tepidisphaeraceae bacterium]